MRSDYLTNSIMFKVAKTEQNSLIKHSVFTLFILTALITIFVFFLNEIVEGVISDGLFDFIVFSGIDITYGANSLKEIFEFIWDIVEKEYIFGLALTFLGVEIFLLRIKNHSYLKRLRDVLKYGGF